MSTSLWFFFVAVVACLGGVFKVGVWQPDRSYAPGWMALAIVAQLAFLASMAISVAR